MLALNPFVEVRAVQARLDEDTGDPISDYDLILDGSDNFDTRYLVNRLAAKAGKPLISAAITQWEGQISLYDPAHGTPCYECIFPHRPAPGMVPTCAEAGVAAPLPGVVGAMMAMEAVKHLVGAGEGLKGRLMIYDALYAECGSLGSSGARIAQPAAQLIESAVLIELVRRKVDDLQSPTSGYNASTRPATSGRGRRR